MMNLISKEGNLVLKMFMGSMTSYLLERCVDPSWFLVPVSAPRLVYPVCEIVHMKKTLLLIGKSSQCIGGNGFLL